MGAFPRDAKELLTPRVRRTDPLGTITDAVVRALLPPPAPMGRDRLEPVPHDGAAAMSAAAAKRQRRHERNRRIASHDDN